MSDPLEQGRTGDSEDCELGDRTNKAAAKRGVRGCSYLLLISNGSHPNDYQQKEILRFIPFKVYHAPTIPRCTIHSCTLVRESTLYMPGALHSRLALDAEMRFKVGEVPFGWGLKKL